MNNKCEVLWHAWSVWGKSQAAASEAITKQGRNLSPGTREYFADKSLSEEDIAVCLEKERGKVRGRVAPIVDAYRGVRGQFAEELIKAKSEKRPVEIETLGPISFTTDKSIAKEFADRWYEPGVIIRAKIPREAVVASFITAPLYEEEKEVIVNVPKVTVQPEDIEVVSSIWR